MAAQSFSAPIAGTGSTLDLRILMGVDGSEELAFDSINVMGTDAIPGDYNQDGNVDAADYVVWRKGAGVAPTPINYDIWLTNFGNPAGSGSLSEVAVPEPATWLMLLTGVVAIFFGLCPAPNFAESFPARWMMGSSAARL